MSIVTIATAFFTLVCTLFKILLLAIFFKLICKFGDKLIKFFWELKNGKCDD